MDVKTIETKVKKLEKQFGIKDITLVFDRGMVSNDNLDLKKNLDKLRRMWYH